MKDKAIKILKWKIKKLAQWTISRYKPTVIAITGSAGKTSAKEAIYAALKDFNIVRKSSGNFNNEIGMPLTILGDWQKISGISFWPKVIFSSWGKLISKSKYPEILILEYGADKPNDIKYLLEIARPKIAVITAVGDIPVHIEAYPDRESLIREKSRLIEQLPVSGYAVLNGDDPIVKEMQNKTRGNVMTFGFSEMTDVRIINFEIYFEDKNPMGVSFKLEYKGGVIPFRIMGALGRGQAYAVAAASCVSLILGLNLVQISESISKNYEVPSRRMNLLKGKKETTIIDDSYNASPIAAKESLMALGEIQNARRVAILGDMLELGRYSPEAHEEIGALTKSKVDVLITVGPRSRFIVEGALAKGFDKNKIFGFATANEAKKFILETIRKGDVILIKASRAVGLDKIVDDLKAS
ncbi:MAG: UDP-N-acetylmuramoyl-tripeptide--D-alanyl-D-alanine ligase [Candidatus Paceibacterota bacterium]|jgi:UDP-N-acetylmuramoyl-tripeptide--D-alanyl-D-alanine ligase